jgi:hypothetical protein
MNKASNLDHQDQKLFDKQQQQPPNQGGSGVSDYVGVEKGRMATCLLELIHLLMALVCNS